MPTEKLPNINEIKDGIFILKSLKRVAFGNNHPGIDEIIKQSQKELRRRKKCEKHTANSSRN